MCGIAGFTRFHVNLGDKQTLLAMGDAIAHRGPDAHGEYLDDDIGLCHRRLSIIDLSAAGTQPMYSVDNNLVIVFNGEIYNYLELRKDLQSRGYMFRTNTDTEVILAAYHLDGESCLAKLNGMFAFAIWDKHKKSLFIARDRIGKKPLYYFHDSLGFAFASELKSFFSIPEIKREIRDDAIFDFFAYQYIPDPKTIFKNIYKLEPGHWLSISENKFHKEKYWDISFAQTKNISDEQFRDELLDLIEKCTRRRMVSDVPLGAFLSGGVDSSGIVALMSQQSESPITTCSIGFDEEKFDETKFAQIVANQYQCAHHKFVVDENVTDNLEHIVSFFDEPFADPSLVPTYFVSKLARQAVTVAIAGDGGDEIFAGYEKYSIDRWENMLRSYCPSSVRHNLFPAISDFLSNSSQGFLRRGGSLLKSLSLNPAQGFYVSNSQISDTMWHMLAGEELKRSLGDYHPSSLTTSAYAKADTEDHLSKILYTDMKTYLPGGILVKVDRMSMAHSLEVRAPLLDYKVIEYAAQIPARLKLNHGEKKYILKNAFSTLLSDEILYRKKMGFSVPLASWLRNELKSLTETELFASNSAMSYYFREDTLKDIWQQHLSGKQDFSAPLWSALMFSLWFKRYA